MKKLMLSTGVLALLAVPLSACGDDGGGGGGGLVEGTITVEGEPLEGASVGLYPVEGGADPADPTSVADQEPAAETTTDADGTYSLEGVADDEYTVLADIGDIPAAASCIVLNTAEVEAASTETVDVDVPVGYQPMGPISLLLDGGILACG